VNRMEGDMGEKGSGKGNKRSSVWFKIIVILRPQNI